MSAAKVGEIFVAAGAALSKLGELTAELNRLPEPSPNYSSSTGKWTEREIAMLHQAIEKFGTDLNRISEIIKTRTLQQIEEQLKKAAYANAGIEHSVDSQASEPNVDLDVVDIEGEVEVKSDAADS